MFREQLHTTFDNISPSPELLDRVSAMMSEEVNRKKAPLRMNVVKYGGIAAALALAAGGTLLVINSANNGVKTSDEAPMMIGKNAIMQDNAYNGVKADEAAADSFDEGGYPAAGAAAEAAPVAPAGHETEQAAPMAVAEASETENESADDGLSGVQMIVPTANEGEASAAPADEISESAAKPEAAERKDGENAASDDTAKVAKKEAEAEEADDADTAVPDGDAGFCNGEAPAVPTVPESASVTSADPGTGLFDTDPFMDIRTWSLSIPGQLEDLVDGVRTVNEDGETVYGDRWHEYVSAVYHGADSVTCVEYDLNIYTFIKYFNIPIEDARAALYDAADTKTGVPDISLTREEADIILTMDIEKITAAFANPYAIVKGTMIYTPAWLYVHSYEEYEAAGITKDDILAKYDLLTTMADRFSDAVIDTDIQAELNSKLDGFLNS